MTHNSRKTLTFFHPPGCHVPFSCGFWRIAFIPIALFAVPPLFSTYMSIFYIYTYIYNYILYITGEILHVCLYLIPSYYKVIMQHDQTLKKIIILVLVVIASPFVSLQTSLPWFHLSPVLSAVQFLHRIRMQHGCQGLGLHLAMAPM